MSNPIEASKEELEKIKQVNTNIDIESIFDIVKNTSLPTPTSKKSDHKVIHSLDIIKAKLSETKIIKNDRGIEESVPAYSEEDKVKIIFGLLAEKGLNLIDSLEKILERDGYKYALMGDGMMEEGSNKLIENINETFSKTTDVLRDIAEMQYKKSKLELEKENLRIQDYKAKLKEKELTIKEKAINKQGNGSGNTNIIAVASQAELIALMKSQKEVAGVEEKDTDVIIEKE
jgi:hypothetical protein